MILRAAEISLFLDGKRVEKYEIANLSRRADGSWCSAATPELSNTGGTTERTFKDLFRGYFFHVSSG